MVSISRNDQNERFDNGFTESSGINFEFALRFFVNAYTVIEFLMVKLRRRIFLRPEIFTGKDRRHLNIQSVIQSVSQ